MQLSDFTFPHPVLTDFTDDVDSFINYEESITEEDEDYSISINFELDNHDLLNLLKEKKAVNICEVQCTGTLYRQIHSTEEDEIGFKIPRKDVRGRVELDCFLVSNNDISKYRIADYHPDYMNFDFEIEKGDLLAYYGKFFFNANIRYKKLKAVSSFLEIEPDDNIDSAAFILEEPKIIVKLPQSDYDKYCQNHIGRNKDFAAIFHSSIVFTALLHALYNIKEHSERTWADVIKMRMEEEEFKNLSLDDRSDLPQIAQQLLGKPINRLIDGLDQIYTTRY